MTIIYTDNYIIFNILTDFTHIAIPNGQGILEIATLLPNNNNKLFLNLSYYENGFGN